MNLRSSEQSGNFALKVASFVFWVALSIELTQALEVHSQIQELTRHASTSSRELLQPRHQRDFTGDSIFDKFSRTVCLAGAVPRKELFETWATALLVQDRFHKCNRVADLACGHGLLSWALLVLGVAQSAICIDKRMPGSAELVEKAMKCQWPQLASQWDFVEGKIDAVQPSSSTLLCSIHACGILSDSITSLAIRGNAPLVLLPCCHTKKTLTPQDRAEYGSLTSSLSDYIDTRRIERLQKAGFDVERTEIPSAFTPMNLVIMATPPAERVQPDKVLGLPLPPLFSIPIGNDSISIAKHLSGRKAAELRNKRPPPSLCVSLFLPGNNASSITPHLIEAMLPKYGLEEDIHVEYADKDAYLHPNGRFARTFRIVYNSAQIRDHAKEMHAKICETLPLAFPGAQIRHFQPH